MAILRRHGLTFRKARMCLFDICELLGVEQLSPSPGGEEAEILAALPDGIRILVQRFAASHDIDVLVLLGTQQGKRHPGWSEISALRYKMWHQLRWHGKKRISEQRLGQLFNRDASTIHHGLMVHQKTLDLQPTLAYAVAVGAGRPAETAGELRDD